jgi:hypothetical protein
MIIFRADFALSFRLDFGNFSVISLALGDNPATRFFLRLESRYHCFDDSDLNVFVEDGIFNDQYLPWAEDSDPFPTAANRRPGS